MLKPLHPHTHTNKLQQQINPQCFEPQLHLADREKRKDASLEQV